MGFSYDLYGIFIFLEGDQNSSLGDSEWIYAGLDVKGDRDFEFWNLI